MTNIAGLFVAAKFPVGRWMLEDAVPEHVARAKRAELLDEWPQMEVRLLRDATDDAAGPRVARVFTTKFNVGDTVYELEFKNVGRDVTCPICEGGRQGTLEDEHDRNRPERTAVRINGKLFECPECSGEGFTHTYEMGYVIAESRITRIKITADRLDDEGGVFYELSPRGGAWQSQLHATKADAEAALQRIKERNHEQ